MVTLVYDLESDGLLDTVTRIWCLGIADADTGEITMYNDQGNGRPSIAEGIERLKNADVAVAHNGLAYDYKAILKVTGQDIGRRKQADTLVMGRLLDPERQSHTLESYGEEMGVPKGDHSDWSQWSQEMETYCEQDVRVGLALYKRLSAKLEGWGESVQLEHDVAWIISLQEENGFALDLRAATEYAAELRDELTAIEKKLMVLFPPVWKNLGEFIPKRSNKAAGYVEGVPFCKFELEEFNPKSTKQLARRLTEKYGWKPSSYTEKGAPQVDEPSIKKAKIPDEDKQLLLRFLRVSKLLTQLDAPPKKNGSGGGWIHFAMKRGDGRVHGRVNSNGAVTGRMTHSSPNSANIDKEKRMRALWIPRIGWILVGCDAEGLELRLLAHYLGFYDGGVYAESVVFGKKEDETDAHSRTRKIVGLYLRDSAKTFIYAMIYGGGDEKLAFIIFEDASKAGQPKPKGAPKKIGKEARAKIETGLTGFGKLKDKVAKAVAKHKSLPGLDGRRINVRSAHSALNALLQGAGAIVMKKALVLFYEWTLEQGYVHGEHYGFCANVHDEVQIEVQPNLAELFGKSFADCIRRAGEHFNLRCPLAGSFDIGANWSETH